VLAVAAGVFLATRGGDDAPAATATTTEPEPTTAPEATSTTEGGGASTTTTEQQPPATAGDRISIGVVSYQALGGDWQPIDPTTASVLPEAAGQSQVTQADAPTPGGTFVASVMIGFLPSDITYDGPDDLQAAALTLAQGLVTLSGAYPDGTTGEVTAAEPRDVDAHPAFLVTIELAYDIDGLNATGETVRVAVIDTGQQPAAFWGSVPNDAPQLVPDMEAALGSLTVDE
jgi:hypothetical protein